MILRWPGSDPRPIYLGMLLQQLHLQPVAVLEFLTAMMDYVVARGSVLATRIEGWGSIGDLSLAPPHCQQLAVEPPPPRPRVHRSCNPNPRTPAQPPKQHPNPNPNPNAPPKREPKSAPKPPPKKGTGSRGSPIARSRPATPQRNPSRGPPPTPRRSRSPSPAPRPRSPPNPLARLPRDPRPPQPKSKAKPKARGGGVQIQSGGASVCRFSGQWGVGDRAGQRGPCRGWPPRGWGDVDLLPQTPRTLRHPESVRFGKPGRTRRSSSPR